MRSNPSLPSKQTTIQVYSDLALDHRNNTCGWSLYLDESLLADFPAFPGDTLILQYGTVVLLARVWLSLPPRQSFLLSSRPTNTLSTLQNCSLPYSVDIISVAPQPSSTPPFECTLQCPDHLSEMDKDMLLTELGSCLIMDGFMHAGTGVRFVSCKPLLPSDRGYTLSSRTRLIWTPHQQGKKHHQQQREHDDSPLYHILKLYSSNPSLYMDNILVHGLSDTLLVEELCSTISLSLHHYPPPSLQDIPAVVLVKAHQLLPPNHTQILHLITSNPSVLLLVYTSSLSASSNAKLLASVPQKLLNKLSVIHLNPPNLSQRTKLLTNECPHLSPQEIEILALATQGYTPTHLQDMLRHTKLYSDSSEPSFNSLHQYIAQQKGTKPSSLVEWKDIGGLSHVLNRLFQLLKPLSQTNACKLPLPKGVLLYGPPGCSKTTIAKALYTSASRQLSFSFLTVSGAELYSSYVGETEANIRDLFSRAREKAPCIVFLDEIEVLVGNRNQTNSGNEVQKRVLSTLLNELDGILSVEQSKHYVLLLAATNLPGQIDQALLRPGRLCPQLYVPPPDLSGREACLRIHTKNTPLRPDVCLGELAEKTEGFSGADIENLCREAALLGLGEDLQGTAVGQGHFEEALRNVHGTLGDLGVYESFKRSRSRAR